MPPKKNTPKPNRAARRAAAKPVGPKPIKVTQATIEALTSLNEKIALLRQRQQIILNEAGLSGGQYDIRDDGMAYPVQQGS